MARIALLVAVGDWVTKVVAMRSVDGELILSEQLRFAVVHNDAAAFGVSFGAWTWQVNLAVTIAAIAFMVPVVRDLSRIDKAAPQALGLIVGGALGNLASLVTSPHGVVDFISVAVGTHSEVVLNVADIAAYIGLAMVLRTGFLVAGELRKVARPTVVRLAEAPGTHAWRDAWIDREVSVPVMVAADTPEPHPVLDPTPRPESVRRAELADAAPSDTKVIDIRPHLPKPVTHAKPRPGSNTGDRT